MERELSFARAETCLIMEPRLSNIHGTAHGGELMKIMDSTAGIAAAKHAKGSVVTARVDELVFHRAIRIGDIVTCIAQLCYVGRTSMQIMVRIVVHELDNYQEPETALSAFFTMVHMEGGVPAPVPAIVPQTEAERELYKRGEEKYREIRAKYKPRG
jgi:acyl-CoA hydrolase